MTSSSYLVYLSDCCHIFLYFRKWLNPGYTRLISSRLRPLKIVLPISPKAQYIYIQLHQVPSQPSNTRTTCCHSFQEIFTIKIPLNNYSSSSATSSQRVLEAMPCKEVRVREEVTSSAPQLRLSTHTHKTKSNAIHDYDFKGDLQPWLNLLASKLAFEFRHEVGDSESKTFGQISKAQSIDIRRRIRYDSYAGDFETPLVYEQRMQKYLAQPRLRSRILIVLAGPVWLVSVAVVKNVAEETTGQR